MANKDYLRKKVKYHIRDIHILDPELDGIIETVFEEISAKTRIFKKLFGFTVHEDIMSYNFKAIARLNERVELETTSIVIGDPLPEDMWNFIKTGEFPDPVVGKDLVVDPARARMQHLLDIYDIDGNSVLSKFEERGSDYYFCFDDEWRKINDQKPFVFVGSIVPEIDELTDDMLMELVPTVIAGAKFYINDTMHSPDDTQATNYDFMRWYQAVEEITNRYTNISYSNVNHKKDSKWL